MNLTQENGGGGGKSTVSIGGNRTLKNLNKCFHYLNWDPDELWVWFRFSGGVMRSLDDRTRSVLREKYGDKMAKMNNGETTTFADLFAFACPKFIATNEIIKSTGSGGAADPSLSYNQEAYKKQLAVFVEEYSNERHFLLKSI